jgi:hypothetical protein
MIGVHQYYWLIKNVTIILKSINACLAVLSRQLQAGAEKCH